MPNARINASARHRENVPRIALILISALYRARAAPSEGSRLCHLRGRRANSSDSVTSRNQWTRPNNVPPLLRFSFHEPLLNWEARRVCQSLPKPKSAVIEVTIDVDDEERCSRKRRSRSCPTNGATFEQRCDRENDAASLHGDAVSKNSKSNRSLARTAEKRVEDDTDRATS